MCVCVCVCVFVCVRVYIYIYTYIYIYFREVYLQSSNFSFKWDQQSKFKPWMRLSAF